MASSILPAVVDVEKAQLFRRLPARKFNDPVVGSGRLIPHKSSFVEMRSVDPEDYVQLDIQVSDYDDKLGSHSQTEKEL